MHSVLVGIHAEAGACFVGELAGIVLWRICGRQTAEEGEDEERRRDDDGELSKDRLAVTKVSPLAVQLTNVALQLLKAKLVVDHAAKSDGVTEELKAGDLGAPDSHGSQDQEDVLQDTTKGEDDSRSLANL
jgi:hypothetical protein